MILHRVTLFPVMGKVGELEKVMEEWWQYAQSKGYRISIARQVFASDGAVIVAEGWHESLAAWEQWGAVVGADPTWGAYMARRTVLERTPARTEVFRLLRPAAG